METISFSCYVYGEVHEPGVGSSRSVGGRDYGGEGSQEVALVHAHHARVKQQLLLTVIDLGVTPPESLQRCLRAECLLGNPPSIQSSKYAWQIIDQLCFHAPKRPLSLEQTLSILPKGKPHSRP